MATKKKSTLNFGVAPMKPAELQEFRKTNEAIGLRVVEGNLTLLSRKVYNVMIHHAQQVKEPGVNAPIDTPASKKYFWIPLSHLARDAAYDSNDTKSFKELLVSMQNIKLLMENDRQWTSERLVSSVTLVNPEGLNKRGGQVWFGYAFPPEVHEQVMSPSTYTRLSIVYQSSLKSGPALALYEICRRYVTNPSKVTYSNTVEHWHGVITGSPLDEDNPPVYKYFKRDVLKPAIAEVNQLTDITVELIEHKNGRRVERLQFGVDFTKQPQLEFPSPPVVDTELIQSIVAFGFSETDARDVVAQYPDDLVRMAVSRVQIRLRASNMEVLHEPAGYFRWQLNALYRESQHQQSVLSMSEPVKRAPGPSVMERFLEARSKEAFEVYKTLDDKERKRLFELFRSQASPTKVKLERGVESAAARALFSVWYANELWGQPTAEALASFIELNEFR